jgi:hypothetical protein
MNPSFSIRQNNAVTFSSDKVVFSRYVDVSCFQHSESTILKSTTITAAAAATTTTTTTAAAATTNTTTRTNTITVTHPAWIFQTVVFP